MNSEGRHIGWFSGGMLMLLLLLSACASGPTEEVVMPKEKPVLKVYLYAPESSIVTRGDNGDVNVAATAEKQIKTLDVWVYEYLSPNNLVSYIHLDDLAFDGEKEIDMEISDDFANMPKKPEVDIYVAANVSDLGLALGKTTTLAQLKEVCIGSSYFGLTAPVSAVPANGLPMSGLLRNQTVDGISPIFYAPKTRDRNVQLVRAVSKVRFVFSKSSSNAPVISDLSVSLDAGVLPKEEYLFLEGVYPEYKSRVKTTGDDPYEASATLVTGVSSSDIKACDNPASYAYTTETGQAYETKIDDGITANELTGYGPFYLRESESQLTGTISFTIGGTQKSVPFSMSAAGDFTRNHTWIVYGYFLGSGDLKLNVVDVKAWTEDASNPKVYNW